MNLTRFRREDGAVECDDAVKRLPDSGELKRESHRYVRSVALLLRDHAWQIPIHLPETAILDRLAFRKYFLARGVFHGSGEDLLSCNDRVALGHHLVGELLRYCRTAASDIGAALLDAGECTIRIGLPITRFHLLEFWRQELVPCPDRRAQGRL